MKNYVIINGTNSNTLTGLMINELPPITKPEMRTQVEEIDGRDGDIITKLGYSAYDKTITIGLFGSGYDVDNIIKFFNKEGTIVFSNEPDKYYNFTQVNNFDIERLLKFKTASITFHCQPFKYPLTETQKIIQPTILTSDGESITINNTASDSLKLSLKGNTSQASTPTPTAPIPVSVVSGDNEVVVCGKNVLDLKNRMRSSTTIAGITLTNNGDGTFNVSGTATSNTNVNIALSLTDVFEVGETYHLYSSQPYNSTTFNYSVALKGSGSYSYLTPNNSQTISEPLTIANLTIYVANGTTINAQNVKTMIYKGNEVATTYEPYTSQTYEVDLPVENMLDNSKISSTSGVLTTTYLGGTRYRIQGLATGNKVFMTGLGIPTGNYTISITLVSGSYSGGNLVIQDQSNTSAGEITIGALGVKKSVSISNKNIGRLILWNTSTFDATFDIQIEKGSKSNNYVAYGTTPIELCKIGTYQDYFTKNSGKNLFDKDTQDFSKGYYLDTDGVEQISGNWGVYYIPIKPDTAYTISGCQTNSGANFCWFTNDKTFISRIGQKQNYTNITSPSNASYVGLSVVWNTTSSAYDSQFMLEKGSSATMYEPYGTGLWCKYNAIGKVVLDGSENWSTRTSSSATHVKFKNENAFTYDVKDRLQLLSNYFVPNSGANDAAYSGNAICGNVGQYAKWLHVSIDNTIASDVASFKTWLGTHNLSVYYILNTPYLSLIEDNNLIEQLDNLENAMSYEGTTNIGQVNNDKPFIISAKALEDGTNEVVVNNIGNVYSKPLLALEGSGNVDIYLDNTQILRANVEDKMNIDIAQLEAYNPDTMTLLNRQVIGNYNSMTLQPGNNTIRIDGSLDKATITNYIRWL